MTRLESEISGIVLGVDREGNPHHGPQVDGFGKLKADGSTASGGWIYSGVLGPDKSQQGELAQFEKLSRPRLGLRLAGRSPHYI